MTRKASVASCKSEKLSTSKMCQSCFLQSRKHVTFLWPLGITCLTFCKGIHRCCQRLEEQWFSILLLAKYPPPKKHNIWYIFLFHSDVFHIFNKSKQTKNSYKMNTLDADWFTKQCQASFFSTKSSYFLYFWVDLFGFQKRRLFLLLWPHLDAD